MEIGGSLAVSYGPMSGSGAGRFLDKQVRNKNSVTVVYTRRSAAYATSVLVDKLEVSDGLRSLAGGTPTAADAPVISDQFGTKFVDQVLYGSQLDLRYTVTSAEDIDVQEIEAELKGSIGLGKLSVDFEANFQQETGSERARYQMTIEAKATGVNFQVPSNPSFERANEIINEFNGEYESTLAALEEHNEVTDETNVLKKLTPVGFTLASTADYLTALDKSAVAILDDRMEMLQETVFDSLYKKAQLNKAMYRNEMVYAADPRSRERLYNPYKAEADQLLSELDIVIKECLEYRQQPLASILTTTPPSGFGGDDITDQIFFGLIGEGFIDRPLILEGTRYTDFYYTGYALPDSEAPSGLKPHFSGSAYRRRVHELIASGSTPSELKKNIDQHTEPFPEGAIGYQQKINFHRNTHAISGSSEFPETKSTFQGNPDFDLQIFADPIDVYSDTTDTKTEKDCVKYGDLVFIMYQEDRFLQASTPINARGALYKNPFAYDASQQGTFQWKIQSSFPMDGDISTLDPKEGECVMADTEEVILQNLAYPRRWLNGFRGSAASGVQTSDVFGEIQVASVYQFLLSPTSL